jgi:chaperone modulatory protein CbpM
MAKTDLPILTGDILDEATEITLVQLCRTCSVGAETIEAMVELGILEPAGRRGRHWCFSSTSIKRTRITLHLQRDLGLNLAGAAVVLDLLERIEELETRLRAEKCKADADETPETKDSTNHRSESSQSPRTP